MTSYKQNILPSPFPGLRPFKTEETHLFFGREGQIDEVLVKMAEHHFVAILGTSGSGKSSFMYCGLIPNLHGGFMTEAGSNWRIVVSRPGLSPIENLSRAITKSEMPNASSEDIELRHKVNQAVLRSSSLGLAELIRQVRKQPDEQVLILIDQFEELFRFNQETSADQANETLAFVKLLNEAAEQRQIPIYVVMTMRSDYIGDCAQFPQFTKMINDSHYLIPQMTREQKRQAILGPVAVGGAQMNSRLVQQLLNDLGDNPDQLPILQHALMRTWNFWTEHSKHSEPLDLYHYEAIGGMAEALSMHANEAFEELNTEEQNLCERIFKCLTEKGTDGRGIRRPTRIKDIAAITKATEEEVKEVLSKFRRPGRTLLMPSLAIPTTSDTVIDISHESLMRIWDRLREWVQEESDSVKIYLRLAEAAAMYQRGTSSLWRPPDLQVAMAWEEKEQPSLEWGIRYHPAYERTMSFLANSKQAYEEEQRGKEKMQKKRLQRTRIVALALGLAAIVSAFFLVYARLQTQQAQKNEDLAKEQQELALKSQKDADEQRRRAENKALEAEREKKNAEEKAKEAEQQRRYAEIASYKAQQARVEAEANAVAADSARKAAERSAKEAAKQKELSDANAEKALQQEEIAKNQKKLAEQLRFQAIGQTMAVKSKELEDSTQQTTVAYQAYEFNKKYNSNAFDPDIYSGLYYARKVVEGPDFNTYKNGAAKGVVSQLTLGSDGMIYAVSHDGSFKQWNPKTKAGVDIAQRNSLVRSVALPPIVTTSAPFALGLESGMLELGEWNNPEGIRSYPEHKNGTWGVVQDHKGKGVVSFGADGKLKFRSWDGKEQFTIASPTSPIRKLLWSKKQQHWVALLKNGAVMAWKQEEGAEAQQLIAPQAEPARTFALSPDESQVSIGFESGRVGIWSLANQQLIQNLTEHSAQISSIQYSEKNSWLATASFDGKVLLWDLNRLSAPTLIFDDHQGWVWSVAFNAEENEVITASGNGAIKAFPISMNAHAEALKGPLSGKKLSKKEWEQFVGKDVPYPYEP